jgi:hypothetical protein
MKETQLIIMSEREWRTQNYRLRIGRNSSIKDVAIPSAMTNHWGARERQPMLPLDRTSHSAYPFDSACWVVSPNTWGCPGATLLPIARSKFPTDLFHFLIVGRGKDEPLIYWERKATGRRMADFSFIEKDESFLLLALLLRETNRSLSWLSTPCASASVELLIN